MCGSKEAGETKRGGEEWGLRERLRCKAALGLRAGGGRHSREWWLGWV